MHVRPASKQTNSATEGSRKRGREVEEPAAAVQQGAEPSSASPVRSVEEQEPMPADKGSGVRTATTDSSDVPKQRHGTGKKRYRPDNPKFDCPYCFESRATRGLGPKNCSRTDRYISHTAKCEVKHRVRRRDTTGTDRDISDVRGEHIHATFAFAMHAHRWAVRVCILALVAGLGVCASA